MIKRKETEYDKADKI